MSTLYGCDHETGFYHPHSRFISVLLEIFDIIYLLSSFTLNSEYASH